MIENSRDVALGVTLLCGLGSGKTETHEGGAARAGGGYCAENAGEGAV
ncbi:hypothetical protein [Loktanella salsilacus]